MLPLNEREKSILRIALEDYAFNMRVIQSPNADSIVMTEEQFLRHPDISENRKNLYLRAHGLIAEINNLVMKG